MSSTKIQVDPYLFPARGRKQGAFRLYCDVLGRVDPYLFPARGRKLHDKLLPLRDRNNVDPYLFPARGRKRCIPEPDKGGGIRLIPTFSPQGDGNSSSTYMGCVG